MSGLSDDVSPDGTSCSGEFLLVTGGNDGLRSFQRLVALQAVLLSVLEWTRHLSIDPTRRCPRSSWMCCGWDAVLSSKASP